MKAILMTSVAMAALGAPAFAGPDRYDQGLGCSSMSSATCVQEQMKLDDGNRVSEKSNESAVSGTGAGGSNSGAALSASANTNDNDALGEDISNTADETGDSVANAANEAGDTISHAANEAGDAIADAFH
jgi:hypothetical protein